MAVVFERLYEAQNLLFFNQICIRKVDIQMERQISELVSVLWESGATIKEEALWDINNVWYGGRTLDDIPILYELIDTLEEHLGIEYEANIAIMRECVEIEREKLKVIEEERRNRMRVCEIKRIISPVLLNKLWEPGLLEKILEAI